MCSVNIEYLVDIVYNAKGKSEGIIKSDFLGRLECHCSKGPKSWGDLVDAEER